MKKILVLSDTHGFFNPKLLFHCDWADEIWHAGDWGSGVSEELKKSKKTVIGVYGNIDSAETRLEYPKNQIFNCEGITIAMTHIGGRPGAYQQDARAIFKAQQPDFFICGHSHLLRAERDGSMFYLNPGAAGREGFHQVMTAVRLKIDGRRIFDLEVIDLGKRGSLA